MNDGPPENGGNVRYADCAPCKPVRIATGADGEILYVVGTKRLGDGCDHIVVCATTDRALPQHGIDGTQALYLAESIAAFSGEAHWTWTRTPPEVEYLPYPPTPPTRSPDVTDE